MSTLAVIGSRNFSNYEMLEAVLDLNRPDRIVSGGAAGADTLAKKYSQEHGIGVQEFLPNYNVHGHAAPLVRNKEIVAASDSVIAFWDGKSKGTKHTIDYAQQQGKPVKIVDISTIINRSSILGESQLRSEAWSQYLDSQRAKPGTSSLLKARKIEAKLIEDPESRYRYSLEYVKEIFNSARYKSLQGKENVFLVMPSSSGNQFPLALANELQEHFGGQVIENYAEQRHASGIKHLSGVEKILAERSFRLDEGFVESDGSLKGKNIVLVDDLVSTGVTMDALREELSKVGIKADYICSLVCTSASLTTELSVEKLAQKICPTGAAEYEVKMKAVFNNSLGGTIFHLQRGTKSVEDCDTLRDYIDKKYSRYIETAISDYDVRKHIPSDIASAVHAKHSIELPASIISTIRSALDESAVPEKDIREAINKSVTKVQSCKYSWTKKEDDSLVYSGTLAAAAVYTIKAEKGTYSAYKETKLPRNSVYLGSDVSMESIKNRIEKYAVLSEIRSDLKRAVDIRKAPHMSLDI